MTRRLSRPVNGFGGRVRELRESRGMTQEQLADKAEMHRDTLARIERGGQSPRGSTQTRLARALGVSVGELYKPAGSDPGDDPDLGFVALLGMDGAKELREQVVIAQRLKVYSMCLGAFRGIVHDAINQRRR